MCIPDYRGIWSYTIFCYACSYNYSIGILSYSHNFCSLVLQTKKTCRRMLSRKFGPLGTSSAATIFSVHVVNWVASICGIDGTKFRTDFVKIFVSVYHSYHPQNISRVAPFAGGNLSQDDLFIFLA